MHPDKPLVHQSQRPPRALALVFYLFICSLGLLHFRAARMELVGLEVPLAVVFAALIPVVGLFTQRQIAPPPSLGFLIPWSFLLTGMIISYYLNHLTPTFSGLLDAIVNLSIGFIVGVYLRTQAILQRSVLLMITVTTLLAVKGVADVALDPSGRSSALNPGDIGSRNVIAFHVEFALIMCVALVTSPHLRALWLRRALLLSILPLSMALLLSLSRGAWAATFLGLLALRRLSVGFLAILGILLVLVILVFPAELILSRALSIFSFDNVTLTPYGPGRNSNEFRVNKLNEAFDIVSEKPVSGLGPGYHRSRESTHNSYLFAWIEYGLLGFAGLLTLNILLISGLARTQRAWAGSLQADYTLGLKAAMVAYAGHFLAVDWVNYVYWWSIVGICVGATSILPIRREMRSSNQVPPPMPNDPTSSTS